MREETDSLGRCKFTDRLWGTQTQRSLEHFSIGTDLIPREINGLCDLEEGRRQRQRRGQRRDSNLGLITTACDEILAGQHHDMFPLRMDDGQRHQFNMNVNEVISTAAASWRERRWQQTPVHPSDRINMAQSSNGRSVSVYIAA